MEEGKPPRAEERTEIQAVQEQGQEGLVPGAQAVLTGLRAPKEDLNGLVVVLRKFDEATGKWVVAVPGETKKGHKVTPDHLELIRDGQQSIRKLKEKAQEEAALEKSKQDLKAAVVSAPPGEAQLLHVPDPMPRLDEPLDMVLLARLKAGDAGRRGVCSFDQARNDVLFTLTAWRWGLSRAHRKANPGKACKSLLAMALLVIVVLISIVLILLASRALLRELSVEDDLLIAAGADGTPGKDFVAATSALVQRRNLADCLDLGAADWRTLREVAFSYQETWWSLRIARVTLLGNGHVLLEASDGSAVRLRDGSGFVKLGSNAASEAELALVAADQGSNTDELPSATFDLAVEL